MLEDFRNKKLIAVDLLTNLLETGLAYGFIIAWDSCLIDNPVLDMLKKAFVFSHNNRILDPAYRNQMVE